MSDGKIFEMIEEIEEEIKTASPSDRKMLKEAVKMLWNDLNNK